MFHYYFKTTCKYIVLEYFLVLSLHILTDKNYHMQYKLKCWTYLEKQN